MAFDIEKMKADGVSTHLIELASMDSTVFLTMIARRLENDELFKQFMGESASSIEGMYPYAVAAGLMSESDREWLLDEGNPYKPQNEVWFTSTDTEGQVSFSSEGEKTENGATTNKTYQEWLDLFNNASQYELTLKSACGEQQMPYLEDRGEKRFASEDAPYITAAEYMGDIHVGGEANEDCLPIDIIVTKK